jgi:hypothetical protein
MRHLKKALTVRRIFALKGGPAARKLHSSVASELVNSTTHYIFEWELLSKTA